MHDYLEENPNLNGIQTNYACDLELAQTIYSRIKEVLPDINDETARKYFEIALDNYILYRYDNKIKNQKRKRLGLRPTFNR